MCLASDSGSDMDGLDGVPCVDATLLAISWSMRWRELIKSFLFCRSGKEKSVASVPKLHKKERRCRRRLVDGHFVAEAPQRKIVFFESFEAEVRYASSRSVKTLRFLGQYQFSPVTLGFPDVDRGRLCTATAKGAWSDFHGRSGIAPELSAVSDR